MELFDILRKRSHAQREFDIVGRSIVEAQAFFDQCAKARAERVDRRKEDLLRFATIFLSFLGIAGFIVSVADGGDSWLKSVLIRAMAGLAGEDPLKEWRYELAAYVTVVILAALARLGIFRLPGQERAEGVGQLWLSGGIGLALLAPFMVSNVANFGGGASLAVILPLGVGWMVTQARPNVLKGARREFHAAWLLMTLLIGGLAFMTSMHALDATH